MTAFPTYSTGTVGVANGATSIVGSGGANWSGANAKPGDDVVVDGHTVVVIDVTDSTHLAIDAWPYTTVAPGATYKIIKRSPLRFAGGDAMADVSTLVAALNTDGFYVFVDPDLTEPDPSYGEEDQFAFQPSTSKLWLKTGGIWVFQGIFKGFNITGAWSSLTTYAVGDTVSLAGSSYVALAPSTNQTPPNVTYWQVLASKGDTGATGSTGSAGAAGVASGIRQTYSTTTTDSDPGSGNFRLNNATPASATAAYLDNLDAGGATVSGIFDLFDDSTSTTRGFLRFQKGTDPTVWAQYRVTGSVVDGTGYRKLTLASGAASGSFTNADVFSITFSRTGDSSSGDLLAANNLSDLANAQSARGNLRILSRPQGRLTLQTAEPVMNVTRSPKTTIYYTPYVGDQIPLYDGTKFTMTQFAEVEITAGNINDTTKNPSAIGASKVNDWFIWSDSGTLRLSHGPDWASDVARTDALTRVNGIWLNAVSITNGPAASRGTYVGTTRSNSSSQLSWILGASASGGTAAFLGVYNPWNRVLFEVTVTDSGASYNYTSATIRQARASAGMQITFVRGLLEDAVQYVHQAYGVNAAAANASMTWGVGHDSITAYARQANTHSFPLANAVRMSGANAGSWLPGAGVHYVAALESSDGSNANSFNFGSGNYLSAVLML